MNSYRPCPICKNYKVELLYTKKYPAEKKRILPVKYQIVCCSQCGMIFDDFKASLIDFEQYYARENKYAMENISGSGGYTYNDRKRFQRIINFFISQKIERNAKIMDIGAGKGCLLRMLEENGFKNLCAVESSDKCVEYMKHNASWSVIHSSLSNLKDDFQADLIICSQIFEHLFAPYDSLEILRNILSPDGLLFVEVPDASRYHEVFYKPYHYFDAEHINHFSPASLETLLTLCGFETIASGITDDVVLCNNVFYPNCYALGKKTNRKNNHFKIDLNVRDSILTYIEKSEHFVKQKKKLIETAASGERCFIWGLGSYGLNLLEQDFFANWNIAGLIDSDCSKQGNTILDYTVYSPEILKMEANCCVCITSAVYEEEIRNQLKKMGFAGKILSI